MEAHNSLHLLPSDPPLKKKKSFRDWVVQNKTTIELRPLWKDLHPIIGRLIFKPMVRAIFSYLFGAHVVKCRTLCHYDLLPAYAPNIYKVSWTTCAATSKFLIQRRKKKPTTFPQEFSNWEMLKGWCKRKDEVTEDLNSDPNFQSTIKMSLLFYLKELTNYCWTSYLGGENVSVFLGLGRRWGTGKIWNTGWVWCSLLCGQQCWGQEMP